MRVETDISRGDVGVAVAVRLLAPWVIGRINKQQNREEVLLLARPPEERFIGFAEAEVGYLARQVAEVRPNVLGQEIATKVGEDFGLVQFVRRYAVVDGRIVDITSGEGLVEVVRRGGNAEEVAAMEKIEHGLAEVGGIWVHFSPKNEKLNYSVNCIDYWRMVDGEAVSIRLVVENDETDMRHVWKLINGGVGLGEEENLLANPVASQKLKLAQLFEMAKLAAKRTEVDFKEIESVVQRVLTVLCGEAGDKLFEDQELIWRAYSIVYKMLDHGAMTGKEMVEVVADNMIRHLVGAQIVGIEDRPTHGCGSLTQVFKFADGQGLIIRSVEGGRYVVEKGSTEGKTYCKQCGCWYSGSKCPLCSKGD